MSEIPWYQRGARRARDGWSNFEPAQLRAGRFNVTVPRHTRHPAIRSVAILKTRKPHHHHVDRRREYRGVCYRIVDGRVEQILDLDKALLEQSQEQVPLSAHRRRGNLSAASAAHR